MKPLLLVSSAALWLSGFLSAQLATLHPGDTIRLQMRGIPDKDRAVLNGHYRISQDGKLLGLPFLDPVGVKADGLTEDQLARAITAAYRKAEIYAMAEASVMQAGDPAAMRQIMILGRVGRPVQVPYSDRMTAIDAVATAGGVDRFGQIKRVTLFREGQGSRMLDLTRDSDRRLPLLPGDRLGIDKKGTTEP